MPPEEKQTLGRGGILGSRGFCYKRKIEIKPTQMTKRKTWLELTWSFFLTFFLIKELGKKGIAMPLGTGIAEELKKKL